MEEYQIMPKDNNAIRESIYTTLSFSKHEIEYGIEEAKRIKKNAQSIFISTSKMSDVNRNLLLVGRVQSGKTANLEMLTAIAFDNGYNSVIIYGGYDSVLLDQTTKRFEKAFDVGDDSPVKVFSTSERGNLLNIDQDIIDAIFENENGKVIFVSMKRPKALEKINTVIDNIDINSLNLFIIDDEGDQASLNTEYKKSNSSPTYSQIVKMKKRLDNPVYLSVTATPQALIFSPVLSELRPSDARLILPGNKYTGADSFHILEGNVYRIKDETSDIVDGKLPPTLKQAINYHLIASAIMRKRGINNSDMIVHTDKEISIHKNLNTNIDNYLTGFKYNIDRKHKDLDKRKDDFKQIYENKLLFKLNISSQISFEDLWPEICLIVKKMFIVLQNGQGKITMAYKDLRPYKIFIGGDLLQRGITFKKLVTTYFTRWPKTSGNMDTTLQRARWFGYRFEYIDLCKIFCTSDIAYKFSKLTEVDNDLWNQFESIEKRELSLDDILIDENDTGLNPARANVTTVKTFSFRKKWFNQSIGTYNLDDINFNNCKFNELIKKYDFQPMFNGRTDNKPSAWYSPILKHDFLDLINQLRIVFSTSPFNIAAIEKAIKDERLILQLFWNPQEINNPRLRERSFTSDMKISALQQGADTTDENKRHYLGDSFVIKDESAVTIQVFQILPIIDEMPDVTRKQFMYSIHFPTPRKTFQWNK